MRLHIAMILHGLMIAGQIVNALSKLVPMIGMVIPAEYQVQIATVLAGAQAMLGWIQAHYNTDGTPQAVAFTKQ